MPRSFERQYDARDRAIAHSNAVNASSVLTAALVEAGIITTQEAAGQAFWALKDKVYEANLSAAGAEPNDSLDRALSVVEDAGLTPVNTPARASRGSSAAGDIELNFSKYKGKTIAEVYEEDATFVSNFLANKTTNEFIKAKAQEFMAQVG